MGPAIALLIPTVLGIVLVAAFSRDAQYPGRQLVVFGAGYFAGWMLWPLGLWILGPSRYTGLVVAGLLLSIVVGWIGRDALRPRFPTGWKVSQFAAVAAALLIVFKLLLLVGEVSARPIYPWDAWAAWAVKAKVWFSAQAIVPFVAPDDWVAAAPGTVFTNNAWHYPPSVSLVQLWMAQGLGEWDERYLMLPWVGAWLAMLATFFGALRREAASLVHASLATYVLSAAPIINTHVALAGYADIWVAGFVMLGAAALVRCRQASGASASMAVLACAVALVALKLEGALWAVLLIVLLVVQHLSRGQIRGQLRLLYALGAAAAAVIAAFVIWIVLAGGVLPLGLRLEYHPVGSAFAFAMFASGDWSVLWYLIGAGLVVAAWRWRGEPAA